MREFTGASSSRRIVVNGVRLAYDDEGNGPALLCLHAIGHGAGDFAALRKRLKHRHRVIALDWPGHGASDAEAQAPSDARFSQHLEAFIDALGLEQPIILGNSVGGAAAIRYAAKHPHEVRALILANPGGLFQPLPGVRLCIRFAGLVFAAGAAGARWFPRFFAAYCRRMLPCEPAAEQRSRIVAAADEIAPLLAQAWRGFADPSADVRHLAAEVTCPVLITWAILDPINGLWLNRGGISRFPDARLTTFLAGHSPFLEMPDEFLASFDAFEKTIGTSDRGSDNATLESAWKS